MRALSAIRNLTGGRVPPLTRTALLCGLGLFLLAVLFVRPEAGGSAPAPALGNGVRLVPPGDARTESVVLLDSSAVFFPSRSAFSTDGRGEAGQPEDAPFPRTAPVLQFDPAKPLAKESVMQIPRNTTPKPHQAVPLSSIEPFTTFGSAGFKQADLDSRAAFFEVYPLSGANRPILNGKITHFKDKNGLKDELLTNKAPFSSIFEGILSIDSLGVSPWSGEVRHSGSKPLDEAIRRWVLETDWGKQLPPGSYRLIVGP